jgi:hypothetical protein
MASGKTWALVLGGLGLAFLAGAAGSSAEAPPAPPPPRPPGSPDVTVGEGSPNQQRPLPDLDRLSAASVVAYISTLQQELNALGYAVTVNGNLNDPATVDALHRWESVADNVVAANAYGYGTGGTADTRALMNAIDDQVRNNLGVDRASDYIAPGAPPSSGLTYAPARAQAPSTAPEPSAGPPILRRMGRG